MSNFNAKSCQSWFNCFIEGQISERQLRISIGYENNKTKHINQLDNNSSQKSKT